MISQYIICNYLYFLISKKLGWTKKPEQCHITKKKTIMQVQCDAVYHYNAKIIIFPSLTAQSYYRQAKSKKYDVHSLALALPFCFLM